MSRDLARHLASSDLSEATVIMFERTQIFRPELEEASSEAEKSPDTHWTSQLSASGMTRIARSVILGLTVEDEDPTAGFLYEAHWH